MHTLHFSVIAEAKDKQEVSEKMQNFIKYCNRTGFNIEMYNRNGWDQSECEPKSAMSAAIDRASNEIRDIEQTTNAPIANKRPGLFGHI